MGVGAATTFWGDVSLIGSLLPPYKYSDLKRLLTEQFPHEIYLKTVVSNCARIKLVCKYTFYD